MSASPQMFHSDWGNPTWMGMWDCEALDQFFDRALSAHHDQGVPLTPRAAHPCG